MNSLTEIYSACKIMPALAMHQMRVAAVTKCVIDNLQIIVDASTIIQAALFHDMGNIIKSDLSLFPEFTKPKGISYWENVKAEYIGKYGPDENTATVTIAKEIGLDIRAIELIQNIGFSKMLQNRDGSDFGTKILEYADMRVGPYCVVSIMERIKEGRVRYAGKKNGFSSLRYTELTSALEQVESDIFNRSKIRPEDITDMSIAKDIGEFRDYKL